MHCTVCVEDWDLSHVSSMAFLSVLNKSMIHHCSVYTTQPSLIIILILTEWVCAHSDMRFN